MRLAAEQWPPGSPLGTSICAKSAEHSSKTLMIASPGPLPSCNSIAAWRIEVSQIGWRAKCPIFRLPFFLFTWKVFFFHPENETKGWTKGTCLFMYLKQALGKYTQWILLGSGWVKSQYFLATPICREDEWTKSRWFFVTFCTCRTLFSHWMILLFTCLALRESTMFPMIWASAKASIIQPKNKQTSSNEFNQFVRCTTYQLDKFWQVFPIFHRVL